MTLDISSISSNLDKLQENQTLKEFIDLVSSLGPSLIFGGAVRDWIVGNTPRDIDIVIDCPTKKLNILNKYLGNKNKFDGYKLKVSGVEFDIWALETTWAFKNDLLCQFDYRNFNDLTFTTFLDLDAIGYRLDTKVIYENGFQKAMDTKTLGIMHEPNPYPFLCVSKALVALAKYDLKPSVSLKNYIVWQQARGYKKNSFDKYNEMTGLNYTFEECMERVI